MAIEKAPPMTEVDEDSIEETATLDASILSGQEVSEGDVVRLRVVSVDEEGGSIIVAYAKPKPEPVAEETETISEFAGKFDPQE